jgi:hypothetical protein
MLSKFWWGSKEGERKIHWMSWERLSKSKKQGGMRFRSISNFNKSLLGKHCWTLATGTSSLMARVFNRYGVMGAKAGFSPSYAWRSMLCARDILARGSRWIIGNGEEIKVWHGNWILTNSGFKVMSPIKCLNSEARVSELIDHDTKQWRRDLVRMCFN